MLSRSGPVWLFATPRTRLFCLWDSKGKNTGVGCHSLLQGILFTQRLNLSLLHCRQVLYHLSYQGKAKTVEWDVRWWFCIWPAQRDDFRLFGKVLFEVLLGGQDLSVFLLHPPWDPRLLPPHRCVCREAHRLTACLLYFTTCPKLVNSLLNSSTLCSGAMVRGACIYSAA